MVHRKGPLKYERVDAKGAKGAKGAKFYRLFTILLIPSFKIGTLKIIIIPNFKSA